MGASAPAIENRGASDDTRNTAVSVTTGNQLRNITAGPDTDGSLIANTTLCDSNTTATSSIVRVLVRATVRHHTRLSYIRLDGSNDEESEGEAAPTRTAAPELLLRSELSFVMSSSVLLPFPGHNYR